MDHAIVLAAGTGIEGENLSLHARRYIGEILQLKRLIIIAQRSGIKKFTIIVEGDPSDLKKELEGDGQIEGEINWVSAGLPLKLDLIIYIVIQSNVVISPEALVPLVSYNSGDEYEVGVLIDEDKDAWVKVEGEKVDEVFPFGGKAVGIFVASGAVLEKVVSNSLSLREWLQELTGRESVKPIPLRDGYWMRMTSDEGSVKKAEDILFANITKSTSGWMSRNINSRFSIPVSRLLIRTPLTPNIISAMIGFIGILSGVFYYLGRPVLGAFSLELSTIFDRCDGEVARIKLMESRRGQWIDTIFDHLSFLSFVIGVPLGFYKLGGGLVAITLGGVNLAIFLFFVAWSFYFLLKYADSGSVAIYSKRIDELIPREKRSFFHRILLKLRPGMKREVFSFVFLLAAIFGGYIWVLSLSTFGLVLTLIHQIDDVIKLRKKTTAN